ncbi:MAG: DUF4440 domain-containing protein [Alphaproteobacteria bacterium]|nr:DUF4440 domain-containing protein [Alphaproteobacteria bacterium]
MTLSRRNAALLVAATPAAACALWPGDRPQRTWADRANEIRGNLETQQSAWNNGDLEGFMRFYWRDPRLVFVSGGTWTVGWDAAYARYQRTYPDRATMGQLAFSDLQVTMLDEREAYAWGRWTVTRAYAPVSGMFTLIWRNLNPDVAQENWYIVHDHTSVGDQAEGT